MGKLFAERYSKAALATVTGPLRIGSVRFLSVYPSLSVRRQNAPTQKTRFSQKNTRCRDMVSIDDLLEVPRGLFKEPIIGPPKIQDGGDTLFENREIVILNEKSSVY